MSRDYKDEYQKFQSSDKKKKYRAKLNKYNRDKGTYGNGDGKDASHGKGGKITGFKDSSANKGKKEKSRLKGSKRKKYQKGGFTHGGMAKGPSHAQGGIPGAVGPNRDPIEFEGGEFIVKADSVNEGTLPLLEFVNELGTFPMSNAMGRSQVFRDEEE